MPSSNIPISLAVNETAGEIPGTINQGEPLVNVTDEKIFIGTDDQDNYFVIEPLSALPLSDVLTNGNAMGGTDIDGEDNASINNLTGIDATNGSFDSIGDDGAGSLNITTDLDLDGTLNVLNSVTLQDAVTIENGLDMSSTRITSLKDPQNAQDAVTRSWVEGQLNGLDPKQDVRAATDGTSVDLTSTTDPGSIDGVTLNDGDRVLLKDQNTASENGIYVANTATDPSTWTRAVDMDDDSEVDGGEYMFVTEGTVNGDDAFVVTSDQPTLGTDPIEWAQFSALGQVQAGAGLTKSSNDTLNANAADNSVTVNADDFAVNPDGSTLETDPTEGLRVGSGAAGDGLQGGSGSALGVVAGDDSIQVNADNLAVNLDDSADGLENTGSFGDNPLVKSGTGLNLAVDGSSLGVDTNNALEVKQVDAGTWSQ